MAPWNGPRHRSWASNSNIGALSCLLVFVVYVVWDIVSHDHVPTGISTLLGIAGGAWFGGITDDKRRRDQDVEDTGNRAEATADRAEAKADDALQRSDTSIERETDWSQHRDHAGGHDDG